jgi:acyl-[acyl-carrier-protein] desaturase
MPGIAMPNFKELADVVRRVGIYGPWDYKQIVEEALAHWKIDLLTGLNEAGRKAQEMILELPKRLEKVAQYIERKSSIKSFRFDLIYGRTFSLP